MRRFLNTAALLTLVALAGCDSSVSTVSGKVTYKGKPVVFGTVSVTGPDGMTRSGPIEPDGSFSVSGVGVGEGKVTVTSLKPPDGSGGNAKRGGRDAGGPDDERDMQPEAAAPPEVVKNWFPIPPKYGDPKQSGLTVQVGSGEPAVIDLQ